jgi:hypothetical protein
MLQNAIDRPHPIRPLGVAKGRLMAGEARMVQQNRRHERVFPPIARPVTRTRCFVALAKHGTASRPRPPGFAMVSRIGKPECRSVNALDQQGVVDHGRMRNLAAGCASIKTPSGGEIARA